MIARHLNASVTQRESSSHGSYPTDKEIAFLAFEHWKREGSPHLRPEHWLSAEKKLLAAYAAPQAAFVHTEDEELWEQETETSSACVGAS